MLRVYVQRHSNYPRPVAPRGRYRAAVIAVLLVFSAAQATAGAPREQPSSRPASVPCTAPGRQSALVDAVERLRTALHQPSDSGISVRFKSYLEGFKNFRGGIRTAPTVGAPTLDLGFTLDTQRVLHWPGGTFHALLEYHGGQDPSKVLVGDLQTFDGLNFGPYFQFSELWYEQKMFANKLCVKLGKLDANNDFGIPVNGLPFLSTSAEFNTTMLSVFPTSPDTMPGVNVFFRPCESYYLGFGAYYSNSSVNFADFTGHPQLFFPNKYGAFLICETGLKWRHDPLLKLAGDLKVGGWAQTGKFPRLAGPRRYALPAGPMRPYDYVRSQIRGPRGQSLPKSQSESSASSNSRVPKQHGTSGYYIIFDHTLWQPPSAAPDGPGIRCFLTYGWTQGSVNIIGQQTGGGLSWTGLFPGRPKDILGFGPQYACISEQAGLPRSYELALETFYRVQITPGAYFQPDLQYIISPGGQYPDACVLTLRLEIDF